MCVSYLISCRLGGGDGECAEERVGGDEPVCEDLLYGRHDDAPAVQPVQDGHFGSEGEQRRVDERAGLLG